MLPLGIAIGAGLAALFFFVAFQTSVPADGSPCPEASSDEVKAWVESKEDLLTGDKSVEDVAREVESLCTAASASNTAQDFTVGLLRVAETLAPEGPEVTTLDAEELEAEIAAKVGFQTDEPIEPQDVSCEGEVSSLGGSTASCLVYRSDGLELPLIISYEGGEVLIDIDPSFAPGKFSPGTE